LTQIDRTNELSTGGNLRDETARLLFEKAPTTVSYYTGSPPSLETTFSMADKKKGKSKLSSQFMNDGIAAKLYHDSISLRIRGAWRDAGDLLVKCAEVYLHMKMILEAACFYTEAAETYVHIDKGEALIAYQKSIKLYCDFGRFDIGGKLEQKVAYINLYAQHWEDAALHFRKAANFLSGDKLLDQSDHCIEKSAECLVQLGEFKEASHLYQMVAKSCVNSNLRRINSLDHLLMALLCMMAVPEVVRAEPKVLKTPTKSKSKSDNSVTPTTPRANDAASETASEPAAPLYQTKYEALYSMNEQFERIDHLWRRCKEKLFVRNLIKARTEWDLHSYADHIYYWSNVREISACRTILLKVPMMEIRQHIADEAKAAADKKAAEEAAALRRAKKQAKLDTPSLAGSSYQESQKSSYQEDMKDNNRTSLTKDNTTINAGRASIEAQPHSQHGGDGGRHSIQDGRNSVNSGDARDSVSMRN
jgi:hypothetical protein